jgi:hypothetical protein
MQPCAAFFGLFRRLREPGSSPLSLQRVRSLGSSRLAAWPVLQCLGQMRATNGFGLLNIRQGACDLEDSVCSA